MERLCQSSFRLNLRNRDSLRDSINPAASSTKQRFNIDVSVIETRNSSEKYVRMLIFLVHVTFVRKKERKEEWNGEEKYVGTDRIYYSIVVVFLDYEDLNEEHDIGTRDWKEIKVYQRLWSIE